MKKLPYRRKPVGERIEDDAAKGPPLRIVTDTRSLQHITTSGVLFTYAPLFQHGGLRHNPVQEYCNKVGLGQIVYLLALPFPLLGNVMSPFDSLLMVCPKNVWSGLRDHIGSMGLLDRNTQRFTRVVYQEIAMLDACLFAHSSGNKVRMVPLSVFGADCTDGYWLIKPAQTPPLDMPTMVTMSARPETIALGKAMFTEQPDDAAVADALTPPRVIEEFQPPTPQELDSLPPAKQEELLEAIEQAQLVNSGER